MSRTACPVALTLFAALPGCGADVVNEVHVDPNTASVLNDEVEKAVQEGTHEGDDKDDDGETNGDD